jgi:hypothetical protein
MTVVGVIAGFRIPNVGLAFTVVPILVAAGVSILAVFLPGRSARTTADARIAELAAQVQQRLAVGDLATEQEPKG